jgi:D-3-phosphoglycerate dehydrogenase
MKQKVVVTSELPGGALELLSDCDVVQLASDGHVPQAELGRALGDANGLLCLLTNRITRSLIEAAPRLRVIGVCAVGYDNVDVAAASERGIVVCNTPNVLTEATADFTWALLLAAARRVAEADRYVRAGHFRGWELGLFLGRPVHASTLGIVGLGRIGSAVARRARGFGMRVVYHQRRRASLDLERELEVSFAALDELLTESDFVSLHVPLSAQSVHLIGARELALMKADAVLINTSRGALLDESALVEALVAGRLGAAALDVFEREPELEPRLVALENVVLAPHIASATRETRSAMARSVAEDVARVLGGREPRSRVNP